MQATEDGPLSVRGMKRIHPHRYKYSPVVPVPEAAQLPISDVMFLALRVWVIWCWVGPLLELRPQLTTEGVGVRLRPRFVSLADSLGEGANLLGEKDLSDICLVAPARWRGGVAGGSESGRPGSGLRSPRRPVRWLPPALHSGEEAAAKDTPLL